MTRVPVGFVRKGDNGIEMTPDRQVQQAIHDFFLRLRASSSLRQVLLWHHQERIPIPVSRMGEGGESLEWRLPDYQQLLRMVKNPTYAGAFAWGRSGVRSRVVDGRSRKTGGHRLEMHQWQVLLKDHHPGYIKWEDYQSNLDKLVSNRTKSHQSSTGAARSGSALLAGLLRCARCGHKLHTAYRGGGGKAPRYWCMTGNRQQGAPSCLAFAGWRVEKAIVEAVLEACQPLGVEASLEVLEKSHGERDQKRKALELALEKAKYEAARARRQYDAADPENRLVAAELENRWKNALIQVASLESRLAVECQSDHSLTESEKERLTTLGADLQTLWNEASTPVDLRKRVLRTVINEVLVDVNHDTGHVEMRIHWAGGVHTPLRVRKNQAGKNSNATDSDVVGLVRELAKGWNDGYIASMLNRSGMRTGKGNSWNETRVKNLRRENSIPVFSKSEARTWRTMSEAASLLGVSLCVIRTMIRNRILPAKQAAKHAPWIIENTNLELPAVRSYAQQAKTGKSAPFDNDTPLLNL